MSRIAATIGAIVCVASALAGCASAPSDERPHPASSGADAPSIENPALAEPPLPDASISVGREIAMRAISLLGAPYRYGAHGPDAFDCSGLVRFVHQQVGIDTPRTAAEQFSAAEPVRESHLAPGDLLFFKTNGRGVSHVGIYAGDGRFVHAPQTGRPVELRELDDRYYRPRLAGAGRLF